MNQLMQLKLSPSMMWRIKCFIRLIKTRQEPHLCGKIKSTNTTHTSRDKMDLLKSGTMEMIYMELIASGKFEL